jgi:hypothetical protein
VWESRTRATTFSKIAIFQPLSACVARSIA